jgi:hypothetical protein
VVDHLPCADLAVCKLIGNPVRSDLLAVDTEGAVAGGVERAGEDVASELINHNLRAKSSCYLHGVSHIGYVGIDHRELESG